MSKNLPSSALSWLNASLVSLLLITAICPAHASTKCSKGDAKALVATSMAYITQQSAVAPDNIKIVSLKCASSYGSAIAHPIKPVTDDAVIYLHKVNNQWEVMSMGTSFDEEFLAKIPKELQH